jgi:N-terminal half of MaoC dehydratase
VSWEEAWQPVVDAVGRDFGGGEVIEGADAVDASALRRFVEPLELDCPLHHDERVAREHGYRGVVAPFSSYFTFVALPMWRPGSSAVFRSDERDAQPEGVAVRRFATGLEPPYTGYFAADFELDLLLPVVLGDRLTRAGMRLVSCSPKETSVGRGAFMTWEWEVRNQRAEAVARLRNTMYLYNPHPAEA